MNGVRKLLGTANLESCFTVSNKVDYMNPLTALFLV